MNKLDKTIVKLLVRDDDPNPYIDKSDWNYFDYLIGYGCPIVMLILLINIIYIAL